jgi:ATP-binding cassette, subfamily B, bacterial
MLSPTSPLGGRRTWCLIGRTGRLLALLAPHRAQLAAILGLLVSSALLGLFQPLFLKRAIDHALPSRDYTEFAWLCVGMLAAPLGAGFLDVAEKYLSTLVGERVMCDLRSSLYRHLNRLPLAYFTSAQPGDSLSRVLNDVQGVGATVTDKMMEVIENATVFVASLTMLVLLDWRLSLIALVSLPFYAIPSRRVGLARKQLKRDTQRKIAEFAGMLTETLSISGALLMKVFGTEEAEATRVDAKLREIMTLSLRQAMVGRWFKLLLRFLENVGPMLLWGVGGYLVMAGNLRLGSLVAAAALLKKLYAPAGALASVYTDLVASRAYFDRVFAVFDLEPAITDAPGARALPSVHGALSFRKVTFAYAPGQNVLDGIDLEIPAGQCVALVGPSGAGKSTLAALVARLYDPTSGAIAIDGHDLRAVRLGDLRARIGVVSQETYLFHASLRENLRYGRANATDDELLAAAAAAHLNDVVAALPLGYDTVVGDRGFRLSGGERQRVAIARALLRDPAILILDEATSALDTQNEHLIQAALQPLLRGRTSLVIAHRLSTIRGADLIVVMDRGRIVERGRHEELIARNGLYAAFCREQLQAEVAPTRTPPATALVKA